MGTRVRAVTVCLTLALLLPFLLAAPAGAQEVRLTTPYPSVAVEPGERVTLDVRVSGDEAAPVDLEVTDSPEGWETSLQGGGFVVGAVYTDPEEPAEVELETTVPDDVEEGAYTVEVAAGGDAASDVLEVEFVVEEAVAGEVTMSSEFPTLRGTADTEFSFDVELDNATPQEQTFALSAAGPEGWQVSASPTGEDAASTATVAGGETVDLQVEATPPPGATAGTYPLLVRASGGGTTVERELEVEITGTYELTLTTPDERLSVETNPGRSADMALLVQNEGSAPLEGLELDAETPSGWEAEFAPAQIGTVPPGESAEVGLQVTPAEDAIVGDYRVTVTATTAETEDEVDVRVGIQTSRGWGAVGVVLIGAALGGLGWVFRKFGRR